MSGNTNRSLLPSAARTASINSEDQRNRSYRGVRVHIDATAITSTPSVVFTIQGKDPITGDYYDLLVSTAIATISDTFLLVYPGATAAANAAVNMPLPPVWRVKAVAGNANAMTYAVTAELLA